MTMFRVDVNEFQIFIFIFLTLYYFCYPIKTFMKSIKLRTSYFPKTERLREII